MNLTVRQIYKGKDGRWRAYCADSKGKVHLISYPRILMEENLGRPLKPDEDVHHIDGNVDNNDISNLQIVKHGGTSKGNILLNILILQKFVRFVDESLQ